MSETEAEMWQRSGLAARDLVNVPGELSADRAEGWDEAGWNDVSDLLGLGTHGGSYFYGRDAVGVALAIICADVKARDVSKAEMLLWKRRGGRGWTMVEANQHPLAELLMTRPNEWHSWSELWRMVVMHRELAQNAYLYKDIAVDGTIRGLIPIQPARCRARISAGNKLFYEIFCGTMYEQAQLGAAYMVVPADRIIHLRGRLWDGLYGLSNLALGSPIFDLVSAIAAFQNNIFGNDGKQPIVFETDQQYDTTEKSEAAFRRLKQQLTERARKAVANGDPILLEGGLTAKTIAINAQQAESKDSFNQQVMRVCGLMDCPPHKIFALEAVAYNNMAAMNRQYYSDCLHPLTHGIQESMKLSLLTRQEWPNYAPQFDQMALMATDLDALTKLVDTSMKDGLMTFDEARELLPFRLNPLAAGGDQRMVPVNMSLIGPDGEVVRAGTGQNPTNPGAGEGESPDNNAGKAGPWLVHSAGAA